MPRPSRRHAVVAAAAAAVIVLVGFVVALMPRLEQETALTAGTPVPGGSRVAATVELPPGAEACQPHIAIAPDSEVASFAMTTPDQAAAPPLELTLSANGYRELARIPNPPVAGVVDVPVAPPANPVVGEVCIRNVGKHAVNLLGAGDPSILTRTRAVVDGEERDAAFIIGFRRSHAGSTVSHLPTLIDRAATFSALGAWAYWLLLPLLAVGVPAAVVAALYLALRAPDRRADGDSRA